MKEKTKRRDLWGSIVFFILVLLASSIGWCHEQPVKIGVLAKRGHEYCLRKWSPTAGYLTSKIPDHTFVIVPLDFEQIYHMVENNKVDFILANSSFYVELENRYGISRIATLKNKHLSKGYTVFGGVIFCRFDQKEIRSIKDLKARSFMAVKETSFGGWQTAWREIKENGLDPYRDFRILEFGGTHDAVVYAVRDGRIDAGTVRTDTLERMRDEKKIDINDYFIINDRSNDSTLLPFRRSTRSYPEWPMAKTAQTPIGLAEKVATALINIPYDAPAAVAAKCFGWTIPLNYQPVHDCLKDLKLGPYSELGKITLYDVVKNYWQWMVALSVLLFGSAGFTTIVVKLNRKLNISHAKLQKEASDRKLAQADLKAAHDDLERRVAERTVELAETNASLTMEIEERARTEDALGESEEKYRDLYENAPIAYFSINLDNGTIIRCNNAAEKLLGYDKKSLLGMKILDLYARTRSEVSKQKETLDKIRAGGIIRDVERQMRHKDGNPIWVSLSVVSVKDPSGHIAETRSMLLDISYRKQLEDQVRQTQKMEAIGTLAGGIAHDFNNIIGAIIGYTDLVLSMSPENKIKHHLEKVLQSGYRAADLVKQILTFSRKTEKMWVPTRVSLIVREVIKLLKATLPSTIHVHRHLDAENDWILADPSQIHQVLMNLCTNAKHAMQKNGGEMEVSLTNIDEKTLAAVRSDLLPPGDYLKLTVKDTGQGMAIDVRERIFEPYFTTKAKGEGTGLGLSVVHGIVKDHGGDIHLVSEVGIGTTFDVFLPIIESSETQQEKNERPLLGKNETIFFVDNEAFLVESGCEMIESLGYNVISETSSDKALNLFKSQPEKFDLVLTDYNMPVMTGIQLAEKILKIRPDLPVLLCSGYAEGVSSEYVKSLGIFSLLSKPLHKKELSVLLRQCLDRPKTGGKRHPI